MNAVVEAVQALPVVEIYTFSLIQCTDKHILKGHSADKYSEDEICKTAKTYFKTLRKHWQVQKDNEVDKENFSPGIDFNPKFD